MSGTLTYLSAAFAAAVVCAVLLVRRRHGDITRRGALACAVTVVWGLVLAGQAYVGVRTSWAALVIEVLRYGVWLVVLRSLAHSPTWLKHTFLGMVLALVGYGVFGWIGSYTSLYALPLDGLLETFGLLLAFAGLVATEQVMRNAREEHASLVRLCSIGIGGQLAFDLFLFSQAQLLGAIDPGAWVIRGLVAAVLLVPFALGVSRMPATVPRVFVSRHVVFYTSAFVAVGTYLCLMALGGYYVREHGGDWGNALQVVFLCGAVAILALLLLSESPLRRLRVFIATHFYRNKYDYRIEWLRFVQTLSAADEPDLHRTAIRAVAQIFGSPGGLLLLRDEEADRFTLRATWPESYAGEIEYGAIAARDPLPAFLRGRQWVIDLREFHVHPKLYGNLVLPRWLQAQGEWRIIAPLLVGTELLGILVLRAPPEPFSITFEDRDLLKTVGRHVAVQLAQHRADDKLAQSRQFDAYNRFAAFVMHDLKNAAAQLQLLVANAARHRNNPVFVDDAIGTIHNTAERMTRLIGQLQSRDMQGISRVVDLAAITRIAVARSAARTPPVVLEEPSGELPVDADPERLGAVIDHVIRNAQEATTTGGEIRVRLAAVDGQAHLRVIDQGMGMEEEFVRQRLFRPFDSTKGSKGMGIGAYQAREYARGLGGDVEVQSAPGAGTDFCIRLPLCHKTKPDSPAY
jgi:putative PEP-CTERM system histidine kinase